MRTLNILIYTFVLFCLVSCFKVKENKLILPPAAAANDSLPKHIIFIIGDGLALSQVSASLIWERNQSWFERFPVVGFHKPYASDDLITDSAAGATAFASGIKTKNSYIGIDERKNKAETIMQRAEKAGFATGILVTCSATHATPAAFCAHAESRAFYDEIAVSMLSTPLDCVIGGGAATFRNNPQGYALRDSLYARGYVVKERFGNPRSLPDTINPFYLFTAENEPLAATNGRDYLPKMTPLVAEYLTKRSKRGSFLLIEGSQIDWALHANDRAWLRAELHDFEKTLQAALEYAAKDGNTLVVVTGDHECGGLSIQAGSEWGDVRPAFAARIHTGALVPVFAFGPGAERFNGIYENTEIYRKMCGLLGL